MAWNQRQFARCPLSADHSAELVIGQQSVKCRLLEMSLGGFSVVVPHALPARPDAVTQLHVDGLTYIVRVTRQEVMRDGIMLALEQIEEIVASNSELPATRLEHVLTALAWAAAICIVATAVYCVTGGAAIASLSFH